MAAIFETQTCPRCNGSGRYSYCETHGTCCFKCGGKGIVFTKRGVAAQIHFNRLCSKTAGEVQVGETIQVNDMGFHYFSKVVEVTEPRIIGRSKVGTEDWQDNIGITISTYHDVRGQFGMTTSEDAIVRIGQSKEQKAAKIEQAIAYQANLTKQGKPRKRRVSA